MGALAVLIGHRKTAKYLAACGIGVAMLIVGATAGYSAAAKTQLQTVVRADAARRDADAELAKARKQVRMLKTLVKRYQEELAYTDGIVESLQGMSIGR